VVGNYAYVADYDRGLHIVDVSNQMHPAEAGFYDTPGWSYGVTVAGNYVYIADGDDGLVILRFCLSRLYLPLVMCNYPR
jgi:hypothetical protein